jgi:hypothetical protein
MTEATEFVLDLGRSASKVSNKDQLIAMMREIVDANPGITQATAVHKWLEELRNHDDYEDLRIEAEEYVANLVFARCAVPLGGRPRKNSENGQRIKNAIWSQIKLATWIVPTIGKALLDCTFAEIASAALPTNKFLLALAREGAPGTTVKEVFPNETALQGFWVQCQGGNANA